MWTNVSRDLPALPALAKANAPVFAHWGAMRRALVSAGRPEAAVAVHSTQ